MLHPKRRIRPARPWRRAPTDVADADRHLLQRLQRRPPARVLPALRAHDRRAAPPSASRISGALTPAGLSSVLTPLMQNGLHRLHLVDGRQPLPRPALRPRACRSTAAPPTSPPARTTWQLRKDGIIRVYDVLFPADVLYKTDEWVYRVMMAPEFGKRMSGTRAAPQDRQVRAGDRAQDAASRSRRCSPSRTSSTCRSTRLAGRLDHRPQLQRHLHRRSRSRPARRSGHRRHGDVGAGARRQAQRRAACRAC